MSLLAVVSSQFAATGVTTTGASTTGSATAASSATTTGVEEPPHAASDSAMSEMPPALAAFLAFLDSQAFTSLLVAFIIRAENNVLNRGEKC